jgi:serine/threonine-protein kinase HipA
LKSGVHICEDSVFDGLFGLFSDSLPDGWGKLLLDRYLMSKNIKFNDITPLDRLCHIGRFGIGALTYEPFDEIKLTKTDIALDELASSSQEILKGTSEELLDTLLAIGGSSAGARPKAMIQINENDNLIHSNQVLQKGYEHFIVKFPNSLDTKDVGKLEYIYSLMAKDANIIMPNTKLLHTKQNSYFTIQRFDRIKDERVHIHSVAGLTHTNFRMPTVDYDDLLSLTLHLTKDINEQTRIFKVAVFNLLTHNRDDHAKNFSFILDKSNNWKLSPAYDLTFSYGPGGEHSTTYLGEGKNPTLEHLKKLAKKHNIKNSDHIINEIISVVSDFKIYAKDLDISKNIYEDVFKSFLI